MRFVLFVEGHTEHRAAPDFLRRYLNTRCSAHIGVTAVKFKGLPHFLKELPKKAKMHLEGPKSNEIIAGVGLLDLYGPQHQSFFPDNCRSATERYEWAVAEITAKVRHPKFRMFFAVHEFEAWLLSDPGLFPDAVRRALPDKAEHPESVDFDEPPSRMLRRLYREKASRDYKKVAQGVPLFRQLNPATAYEKCPRLKAMLDEMVQLARKAGL